MPDAKIIRSIDFWFIKKFNLDSHLNSTAEIRTTTN